MNKTKLRNAHWLLRVILNKQSRRVIDMLLETDKMDVTQIMIKLRLEQPYVSFIIKRLSEYDVIYISDIKGTRHFYSVNRALILRINNAMQNAKENGVID